MQIHRMRWILTWKKTPWRRSQSQSLSSLVEFLDPHYEQQATAWPATRNYADSANHRPSNKTNYADSANHRRRAGFTTRKGDVIYRIPSIYIPDQEELLSFHVERYWRQLVCLQKPSPGSNVRAMGWWTLQISEHLVRSAWTAKILVRPMLPASPLPMPPSHQKLCATWSEGRSTFRWIIFSFTRVIWWQQVHFSAVYKLRLEVTRSTVDTLGRENKLLRQVRTWRNTGGIHQNFHCQTWVHGLMPQQSAAHKVFSMKWFHPYLGNPSKFRWTTWSIQ